MFFFNDTATTEIYTLSLHDALPISVTVPKHTQDTFAFGHTSWQEALRAMGSRDWAAADRKSTRLNSSHANISYAVFCLKKKTTILLSFLPYIYLFLYSPLPFSLPLT